METIYFTEDSELVYIGAYVFWLSNLHYINVPKSVVEIDKYAFYDCCEFYEVNFAENGELLAIDEYAFGKDFRLKTVEFPDKLITIDEYAFIESGLEGTVTIPGSLAGYGEGIFAACHDLKNIKVDVTNPYFEDVDGVVFTKDGTALIEYPAGKEYSEYTVKDGVDSIYDSAFYGTHAIEHVYLPESLVYI